MSKNPSDPSQSEIHPALKSLRALDLDASPFLATRVKANLKSSRHEVPLFKKFWLTRLATSMVVAAMILLNTHLNSESKKLYSLGQPYMIRMDIRAIPQSEIAYAEISLDGDTAEFSSKKFTEVRQKKVLTVSADTLKDKQYLPVIVRGVKAGETKVTVSFYNSNDEVVTSKSMTLAFADGSI